MLDLRNVRLAYSEKVLLETTHLQFHRGNLYTIYGKSGVGKSSLLNKIGLVAASDSAMEYFFDGQRIDSDNPALTSLFIAEEVAFVFQQQNLLNDLTVKENLLLPLQFYAESEASKELRIETILKEMGIEDLLDRYPEDLSGGEEQRVAIARALVADKNIILADEPTNSLDDENKWLVCSLLEDLARKFNKIVIVVSHDPTVIAIGDEQLHFQDKHLIGGTIRQSMEEAGEWQARIRTKVSIPLQKHRRHPLPRLLSAFVSLVVAIAVASFNIQSLFASRYQSLVSQSLENGFLVIHDTLQLNTKKVMDDFLSLTSEEINQIKDSGQIESVQPYMEFPSIGMTVENARDYLTAGRSTEPSVTINGQTVSLSKPYSIQPLFATNTTQRQIQYFDNTQTEGVYLSEQFINNEKLKNIVAGSEVSVSFYVPIALYENSIEKEGVIFKGDGDLYVKQERTFNVLGIVKSEYPFDYSPYSNSLFMDSQQMKRIQDEAIAENPLKETTLGGFNLKAWSPSAVHLIVKDSQTIPQEVQRIKALSSKFSIVSSFENYEQFSKGLQYIQNFLLLISGVLLVLVVAILSFVFYLVNRTRRFEVGILKALGYQTKQVLVLFFKELLLYGRRIFLISASILFILAVLPMQVLQLHLQDIIQFYLNSIMWLLCLTFTVLTISGLMPIYQTCKQSIVDTLRTNR
ncbi:ATP-binding cassette domain-containing protein [Streptococcus marmotae]|uniref:ATP-binding cassette domain-containing protein n=1 Tax=Streptococcus marmotae TaxID=1825069 RepID=UPI0008338DF9|nr:ATP-binding cassette domain-containing protein [Streptococcus marmotae]